MLSFRQFSVGFHVVNIAVKLVQGFRFHRSIYPLKYKSDGRLLKILFANFQQ